jgi:predicted DNA-binding WGR domain protein/BRCT domain type II-containing protein
MSSLDGKIVVFTGTLSTPRAECTQKARDAGATVTGSVSGKTNILVAGPGAGSKIAAAEAKGVDVWTEEEFLAALSGGGKKKRGAAGKKAAAEPPAKKGKAAATKKEPAAKKAPAPKKAPAKKGKKAAAEEEDEEEDVAPPPAKKAAVKKEAAAAKPAGEKVRKPDRCMPNGSAFTVVDDYDVKLMQTNIDHGQNNNKFYILQLLSGMGGYRVHYRWGRLGEDGQQKTDGFPNLAGAVSFFEKKFRDKTKNAWSARFSFVKHSGKYQLVEVEDDDDAAEGAALGKLSAAQIEKGQDVLAQIRAALASGAKKQELALLSSSFYSYIPTTSGRVQPPPLDNEAAVTEKEGLLEFWLRMGFESVETKVQLGSPMEGVRELPLPKTLSAAASNVSDASSINSSKTRGSTLAKQKAGNPVKPMDGELYGAIMLYTGNSIYRKINQVLRENWNGVKPYRNYLRLYLEAMACLPAKKVTLWRGIAADLFDAYSVGSVQTWWSISSCTANKSVAEGFMQQLGGKATLLTLECESAVDVSALSFYPHEAESLLLPGTQLKVLSREMKGNVAHIHVQEIGVAE